MGGRELDCSAENLVSSVQSPAANPRNASQRGLGVCLACKPARQCRPCSRSHGGIFGKSRQLLYVLETAEPVRSRGGTSIAPLAPHHFNMELKRCRALFFKI